MSDMTIDNTGKAHKPAGTSAGGQFAAQERKEGAAGILDEYAGLRTQTDGAREASRALALDEMRELARQEFGDKAVSIDVLADEDDGFPYVDCVRGADGEPIWHHKDDGHDEWAELTRERAERYFGEYGDGDFQVHPSAKDRIAELETRISGDGVPDVILARFARELLTLTVEERLAEIAAETGETFADVARIQLADEASEPGSPYLVLSQALDAEGNVIHTFDSFGEDEDLNDISVMLDRDMSKLDGRQGRDEHFFYNV